MSAVQSALGPKWGQQMKSSVVSLFICVDSKQINYLVPFILSFIENHSIEQFAFKELDNDFSVETSHRFLAIRRRSKQGKTKELQKSHVKLKRETL